MVFTFSPYALITDLFKSAMFFPFISTSSKLSLLQKFSSSSIILTVAFGKIALPSLLIDPPT